MIPLKIAILWHNHQPYYEHNGSFLLPWARLHGVKDYFDLPEILHDYPNIKQTFNVVPSLMLQLEDYSSQRAEDHVQRLSKKSADSLSDKDKSEILRMFFLCNTENMILPYQRYNELFERSKNFDNALTDFSVQDWLDLQVWYNLAWVGQYSRSTGAIRRLFVKAENFTEEDKLTLLKCHLDILGNVANQLATLSKLGQIEISCSPMYHPILPLLCSSKSALESQPGQKMPHPLFEFPEDASAQIDHAIKYFKKLFGCSPMGFWPSEGSLSDKTLELFINHGVKWAATDEQILANSKSDFIQTHKFFPHKYQSEHGEITLFFRDHYLSDRIGFVYSSWNPWDAANDFCHHLHNIRNEIIRVHGENALEYAVVPVILDGENCWEFYRENGAPFLCELYQMISNDKLLQTCTFSEALSANDYLKPISKIRAGSWINANFDIWLGNETTRLAWSYLAEARKVVESVKGALTTSAHDKVMEDIYIAEGSDWFWWYCDSHTAPNKADFDVMFRWRLDKIYKQIEVPPPTYLSIPIAAQKTTQLLTQPQSDLKFEDGNWNNIGNWINAGCYEAKNAMSAMHQVGEYLDRVQFGANSENLYFRFELSGKLSESDKIIFAIKSPKHSVITFQHSEVEVVADGGISHFICKFGNSITFSIAKKSIFLDGADLKLEATITTYTNDSEIVYPRQGLLVMEF